mmetsp:Transcript_15659/g.28091  ORF Transcript_15659/g.28091 Transcript_15659/m.28091 type:complete len:318 (-) Transcript_15659:8-961(-)
MPQIDEQNNPLLVAVVRDAMRVRVVEHKRPALDVHVPLTIDSDGPWASCASRAQHQLRAELCVGDARVRVNVGARLQHRKVRVPHRAFAKGQPLEEGVGARAGSEVAPVQAALVHERERFPRATLADRSRDVFARRFGAPELRELAVDLRSRGARALVGVLQHGDQRGEGPSVVQAGFTGCTVGGRVVAVSDGAFVGLQHGVVFVLSNGTPLELPLEHLCQRRRVLRCLARPGPVWARRQAPEKERRRLLFCCGSMGRHRTCGVEELDARRDLGIDTAICAPRTGSAVSAVARRKPHRACYSSPGTIAGARRTWCSW